MASLTEGSARLNRQVSLPAPVRGLNAQSSLSAMGRGWASVLENFIPYPDRLQLRPGAVDHVTGFAKAVEGLWTWEGPSSNKLFATTGDGVFDATSAGAVGATVQALTSGRTVGANITTGAGSYLILVNGTDSLVRYDGSSWTTSATLGTLTTSNVSAVEVYKQRLFFIEKNSLNLWYLPVNSISGSATSYPLGAIFRRGGYLAAIGTWTVDAGSGPDDHLAVATSNGEVAVFSGTDPTNYATWALKGVYYIGRPLGVRSMSKVSGDLLFLSESGLFPLARALRSATIDKTLAITDTIQALFSSYASLYSGSYGWCIEYHPDIPLLVINIPGPTDGRQLVMNTQSGAWSTFSGWVAYCMARRSGVFYYGGAAKVVKALTGAGDFGGNVVGTLLQAYSDLGYARTKLVRNLRPTIMADGSFSYSLGIANDFTGDVDPNLIPGSLGSAATWGTSLWGAAAWTASSQVVRDWRVVPDVHGTHKAFYLQITSSVARPWLEAWDALFTPSGTF